MDWLTFRPPDEARLTRATPASVTVILLEECFAQRAAALD
jgi:hypothetical protein